MRRAKKKHLECQTPVELAKEMRITARQVRRLCKDGEIHGAVKVGGRWVILGEIVKTGGINQEIIFQRARLQQARMIISLLTKLKRLRP